MLPDERRDEIAEQVTRRGTASVEDLMNRFAVSKMTVWRDLRRLHAQGRLRMVRGGAQRMLPASEPGVLAKRIVRRQTKDRIAEAAVHRFVRSGDVIALEGGTTVMHVLAHVSGLSLTVITNGLLTLNAAADVSESVDVLGCGGILRQPSQTFVGPEAVRFFAGHAADIAFISATGCSAQRGLTDPNPLEIEVKQAMAAAARRVIALVDSSKFAVESLKTVVPLERLYALVSEGAVPEELRAALHRHGVELFVAAPDARPVDRAGGVE